MDYLDKVKAPTLLIVGGNYCVILSKEEYQSLIAAYDNHLKPVVPMALNTGMRKGEILNLKWHNIDLRYGFILLNITKNGKRREIPINATLRETLASMVRGLHVSYVFISVQKLYKNQGAASTITMQPLVISGGGNRIRTDE